LLEKDQYFFKKIWIKRRIFCLGPKKTKKGEKKQAKTGPQGGFF
jgi:hypothetical protein